MSVSTEVQRTLVKSPPELWAELSDPEALGRHLGELDGVRITRAEPETLLEWEAEGASGEVQLKASGFGTKVVLSLTRELAEPPTPVEPEPVAEEPESAAEAEMEPVAEQVESESVALEEQEPEPRRGFFARLFRRRRAETAMQGQPIDPEPEAVASLELDPELPVGVEPNREPEPVAAVEPEPEPAEPQTNLADELAAMEAQIAEQTTELLTSVLDRLGAAHHRPFSRG